MAHHADAACVLKVNINCDTCKRKTMDVLSSIVGVYSVTIDGEQGLAKIYGEVDPDVLMRAIGTAGKHAELVRMDVKHPLIKENDSYRRRNVYHCDSLLTGPQEVYSLDPKPFPGGYANNGYGHGLCTSSPVHQDCCCGGKEQYYHRNSFNYSTTTGGGALPFPTNVPRTPSYRGRQYNSYYDDNERINCCSIM